jgi:hypothetical protein
MDEAASRPPIATRKMQTFLAHLSLRLPNFLWVYFPLNVKHQSLHILRNK